jgi:hypothetical protein
MIFFPTRSRAWALQRFIDNYKVTGATLPVLIIIDEDNLSHYGDILSKLPSSTFQLFPNPANRNLRDAVNNAFAANPNEEFYGIVADDIVPHTDEWDVKLAEACKPHYIAWPNDGIWGKQNNNPELPTHPFIGGDLCRALGYVMTPHTNRHCADFVWLDIANALGLGKPMPEILMEHMHWQNGKAPIDTTYSLQPSAAEGHHQYHNVYKGSDVFKADIERVRKALGL